MADSIPHLPAGEMAEFAAFSPAARKYIGMVLDCVYERAGWRDRWRNFFEDPAVRDRFFANVAVQRELRRRLFRFWKTREGDAEFMPLVMTSAADLGMAALDGFAPYRFLAERLYGPNVRPLLPAAFAAAALLPHHPAARRDAWLASLSPGLIDACVLPVRLGFFPGEAGSGPPPGEGDAGAVFSI